MTSCPIDHEPAPPNGPVDLDEARDWLETFHAEGRPDGTELEDRWAQIKQAVAETGTYQQTFAELEWGTRVAWRQAVRCIGRARWQSLVVRDARSARTIRQVARELAGHLDFATNGGRIRNTITVFPADDAAGPVARVRNDQLIRYAGYRDAGGRVLGDAGQADFTAQLMQGGWTPPADRSAFDLLPWLVWTRADGHHLVPVPREAVLEVPITHPYYPWFDRLALRWHAVPVISSMQLRLGGLRYSCAPFSGWYLVDEIATRNFGDAARYDQLPVVAAWMGLDTSSTTNFWQVRAAVELNTAVLHSFRQAGVRIEEPKAESDLFAEFARREDAAGRTVHADWSWINGHLGSVFGASWHRYYAPGEPHPNFFAADTP
ncbi:nitric oxide synthase oxygenase [Jatrophihabitans endophyticus]|uniref:nitric oxide synthase oxygenase n=1 Tax=Jatrophihabitans endophyticus TaxID=1206085 RepID=UPI001A049B65|nr:nitric oxide synthase oxygenase [Jatrophihabitans endophyticus]MBE7187073.1 nitric oxide synthase oxygenase [Jatrophihabitans endophyticus]